MKHYHTHHLHRGLHAAHFGFLSGLIGIVFMATIGFTVISPAWVQQAEAAVVPFSSSSFWNTPVPGYTALDQRSAQLTASVVQQVGAYGTAFDTANTSPVYVVGNETPPIAVEVWDCGASMLADLASQWSAVPIPFYAVPSAGPNGKMIIYNQVTGNIWEFGHMRNQTGVWQACTGGLITTSSEGVFPAPYGISASGLAAIAGQVTPDELQSGYIDHVIGLRLPQTSGFVSPATQGNSGVGQTPPQGTRFRLDPSLDVTSLGLSNAGITIARAAQTYGLVIWDNAPSVSIAGVNPIAQTARGIPNPYGSINTATVLQNFPWDKLQALPTSVSYAAIVPAITAFSATNSTVTSGGTVTLAWQASNVNRCALPGISDNLPASGTIVTKPLQTSTRFVLRCGGPTGAASSQLTVTVVPITANDPITSLPPAVLIDQPFSGYANIFPEIMSGSEADKVYKVVYYSNKTYLYETAKPPFALNTSRMNNGPQIVDAQIYYRDGTSDKKSVKFTVNNSPETLFATTQSGRIIAPPSIPLSVALSGAFITLIGMCLGTWWGWRKAHLT